MSNSFSARVAPPEVEAEIDACCDRFERAWRSEAIPSLEQFLQDATTSARPFLLRELLLLEQHYRRNERGDPLSVAALRDLHPAISDEIVAALGTLPVNTILARPIDPLSSGVADDVSGNRVTDERHSPKESVHTASRGLHVRCPHCSNPVELLADTPFEDVLCSTCGSTFNLVDREGPTPGVSTLGRIGRFELIARLGVGGFGTVWKARDKELDRLVAVKIPRKGQLLPAEVEHFFREARAAAQLRHPHIVSVFEVGREEETVYIVSDFVRGASLSDWLTSGRPSCRDAASLCETIALALHHAHQQGVVHRDLKPSNIMIDEEGAPHILDFGLAKREIGEITMTVDGQILGTPGYMSPEQARGKSHWTDRRTDVYSLGVLLFRMLTGDLPFRGNAQMQLHHKLTSDAPDPRRLSPAIPRDLATICLKCLERDPNRRYPTALEAAEELRRYLQGEPIRARPLSPAARLFRWALRKPAAATAAALGIVLAVAGPLVAWQFQQLYRRELGLRQTVEQRLKERDSLVRRQKETEDRLSSANAELHDQVAALSGQESGITAFLPSWRISLIKQLVDARQAELATTMEQANLDAWSVAEIGLGLAILMQQLGRNEEALKTLAKIEPALTTLTKDPDRGASAQAARAECLLRMSRIHRRLGNEQESQRRLEETIVAQRGAGERQTQFVEPQVQLLETLMDQILAQKDDADRLQVLESVPPVTAAIASRWPQSPREFYELACFLTRNPPLLALPKPDAMKTPGATP